MDGSLSDFECYLDIKEVIIKESCKVAMDTIDNTPKPTGANTLSPDLLCQLNQYFGPYFRRLETQILEVRNEIKIKDNKIEELENKIWS